MKATKQNFPVVLFLMLNKVVLTFFLFFSMIVYCAAQDSRVSKRY